METKLDQTRVPVVSNLAEGTAASGGIRIQELGMIESIEKFGPELNGLGLEDLSFLDDRKVVIVDARAAKEIARHIDAIVGGRIEPECSRHVSVRVRGIGTDAVCVIDVYDLFAVSRVRILNRTDDVGTGEVGVLVLLAGIVVGEQGERISLLIA